MQLSRSRINQSVTRAKEVLSHFGLHLPEWAHWNCEQWDQAAPEYDQVRHCMLGWDVTDFGRGDFEHLGRTLFTLRNGRHNDPRYPKSYAEKLILDPENQRAPAHFHRSKREDIICIAGGNILVQLERADEQGRRAGESMTVSVDGRAVHVAPNGIVRLEPGMSVNIPPRTIHQFWGEQGTGLRLDDGLGYTISREVSSVCDDLADNFFLEPMERFPRVNEDESPAFYLCHEYPAAHATNAVES